MPGVTCPESEAAILSILLGTPQTRGRVGKSLLPEDFYNEKHRLLYLAIQEVGSDLILIKNYLTEKNQFQRVGNNTLFDLAEMSVPSASLDHHIERVKDAGTRQRIGLMADILSKHAPRQDVLVSELLSLARTSLRDLQRQQGDDYTPNAQLMQAVFKDIEERSDNKRQHVGILSGFHAIDDNLQGFEPKSLTYMIGRPSMGKTALGLAFAEHMAHQKKGLVIFFSLEMGDLQISRRRLASQSGVYLSRIRRGDIEKEQWGQLVEALDVLSENQFLVIDRPKYKTVENLIAMSEALASQEPLAAIFIDHIQLMRSGKTFGNRHLEISYISSELKSIAKDLSIPVIALCQLNRAVETRRDRHPALSDMKESGDLEQDADVVLGIYRETPESTTMEVACLKGRDVGVFRSQLGFQQFTQRVLQQPIVTD